MGRAVAAAPHGRPRGALERDVLACLAAAGRPMSPGEVRADLGDELAYTTVMTTLSRRPGRGPGVDDRPPHAPAARRGRGPGRGAVPIRGRPASGRRRAADQPAGRDRRAGPGQGTGPGLIALGLIPFACSLLLALTATALSRRLSPGVATPLLTLTALATSLATGIVLSLAGFTVLARLPLIAALGGWPDDRLKAWRQLPTGWGVTAAVLAAALLASALLYLARVTWDLSRAHRACRQLPRTGDQLMITPAAH